MVRTHEERIGIKFPDGTHHIVVVQVSALEDDETILRRFSSPVGTIFNVTGTKYKVVAVEPFELERIESVKESLPSVLPMVGQVWKPKDPRRKGTFTVVELDGDEVVTDDGRRIQLSRFNRYERLG